MLERVHRWNGGHGKFVLKLHPAGFQMSRPRHGILFEGLDPHLSKDGLFGKGTYLAEDAAKIDQYLKQDLEWRGNKPDHELQNLYEVGVKHANHVYYALVCRTALGAAAITRMGRLVQNLPGAAGASKDPRSLQELVLEALRPLI